jgi:hypothetical protein
MLVAFQRLNFGLKFFDRIDEIPDKWVSIHGQNARRIFTHTLWQNLLDFLSNHAKLNAIFFDRRMTWQVCDLIRRAILKVANLNLG